MRSTDDLRQRWLGELPTMLTRPTMYGPTALAFEISARGRLSDLCFLDDRDDDFATATAVWHSYGKRGVAGPFLAMFPDERGCVDEVASVFAEQFARLGYLAVDPADADFADLRARFDGQDVRRSEVEAAYGPPSLVIGKRVLCYAPSDGSGWTFIDCFPQVVNRYVPGGGKFKPDEDRDPLVRTVRSPAESFEAGLVLTAYGKVLRWGPGWWVRRPEGLPAEKQAIAAQLREIAAADPSQSLGS